MELAERQLAITYNGEIYNYLELRARLEGLGHRFHTHTDTEVLLHAYAEWGDNCIRELNGMFAFALWDGRSHSVLCARDRFGEKPFLYSWVDGSLAFASEAKALGLLPIDAAIDDGVLAWHVQRGSTWLDASVRTLVRGIRQLLPAHAMKLRVDTGGVHVEREWTYWSIDVTSRRPYGVDRPDDAATGLRELLTDSVRLRLRSDVPVGSCLSGGLDSSTVVALMRQLEPTADLRTFTGRFPGDPLDEGRFARLLSAQARTIAREVEPTPERFAREAERVYWHADFPIGGMSQFAQWCVFHLASQHGVTVLLDGQGSDEQLGGYGNTITRAFLGQLWAERRWSAWLREREAAAGGNPELFSWPRLALNGSPARALVPVLRLATRRPRLNLPALVRGDWLEEASRASPPDEVSPSASGENAFSSTLWLLSFRTMLSSLLRFGDRLSMAHSREVRLPFCDHRVAELAFSLSPDMLMGGGQVKRVLRLASHGLVPLEIETRAKQGFLPPQTRWLLDGLDAWVRDLADSTSLLPMLESRTVRQLAQARRSVRQREQVALWETSNLLAWARYSLEPLRRAAAFQPLVADGSAPARGLRASGGTS